MRVLDYLYDLVAAFGVVGVDVEVVEYAVKNLDSGEKQSVVDITGEVREAVLLELPAYPECGEDCPGFQQKESDFSSFRFFDSSNELEKLKFGNN